MPQLYKVTASNFYGTYSAGVYQADSAEDAKEQARVRLRRAWPDADAFRLSASPARPCECDKDE